MKPALTDEELIQVYFPNQPRYCLEILYKRYHQKIYQQCLWLIRNAEQAKDFSQDIFVKVFQKLDTFQERSRFATARRPGWLYAIARNYCRDQLRRGEWCYARAINAYLKTSLIDNTESLFDEEVMHRLGIALASLSDSEQSLLRHKYEQELSLKELAHQSGLSLSAVKMRLKRSRAKLQQCYAKQVAS